MQIGGKNMKKDSLQYRIIKPAVILIVMVLIINLIWTYYIRTIQMEAEMVKNASAITIQMDAVWDYISDNQDAIEYTSDGIFEYKGIHCAIAGVEIGEKITDESDNIIRYVREEARSPSNNADFFELEALKAFEADSSLMEYWDFRNYHGDSMLRYLEPLRIEDSCLDCHGEPAGVLDKSGYPKDGMQIGDFIGAVSIAIPTKTYVQNLFVDLIKEGFVFVLLMVGAVIILYQLVYKIVLRPITRLEKEVSLVGSGQFNIELNELNNVHEIQNLYKNIQDMAINLQYLYQNLEKEVEIRTFQLEEVNDDLKQQKQLLEDENQYKSEFLAIMSHELRTPLSSIIAYTDILIYKEHIDEKELMNIIKDIKVNGGHLLDLINNILDMARIEAGKSEMNKDVVDWVDLCGHIYNEMKPLAALKSITLTNKVESNVPLMIGDWEKLRRMVENIASNAVKFTSENGIVSIEVEYDEVKNHIFIKVSDNGIGIEKKDVEYIFEKFAQCDSSDKRQSNGTGLGLALARSIAEMHNGEILIETQPGVGSIFTVDLPVVKPGGEVSESDVGRR